MAEVEIADVAQAILAREDLDERSVGLDALDGALVDLADFRLGGQALDDLECLRHCRAVGRSHAHRAVVGYVDAGAGLVDDGADHLAAGADDGADLVRLDADLRDARRVLREFFARNFDGADHLVEDVQARFTCLVQCTLQDVAAQTVDLDVHLDGRDTLFGAANLEVHVAERILVAEDVGEDCVAVAFLDEAHRHTGHRRLDRHAGIHQRECAAANRSHRGGAVGLGDFRDNAQGVGELFLAGKDLRDGALGQVAVTHFATTGAAHGLHFADRVGREVVVQHEMLVLIATQRVETLGITCRAERGGDDGLRLAARKQRRAVRARQDAELDADGAHGARIATIETTAFVQHLRAHGVVAKVFESFLDAALFAREILGEKTDRVLLDLLDAIGADMLFSDVARFADGAVSGLPDAVLHVLRRATDLESPLALANGFPHAIDEVERVLDGVVAEQKRFDQVLLGHLVGFAFDHDDGVT